MVKVIAIVPSFDCKLQIGFTAPHTGQVGTRSANHLSGPPPAELGRIFPVAEGRTRSASDAVDGFFTGT